MTFSISRAIAYSLLLIIVNIVNTYFFSGSIEGFVGLFFLGAIVGEIGIPALIPEFTKFEHKICYGNGASLPPHDPWRRIGLICTAICLFVFGLIMTTHASLAHAHR